MKPPLEPPPGCQELPGYIVSVGRRQWLDSDGNATSYFSQRGIWPTAEEADAAREKFCKTLPE